MTDALADASRVAANAELIVGLVRRSEFAAAAAVLSTLDERTFESSWRIVASQSGAVGVSALAAECLASGRAGNERLDVFLAAIDATDRSAALAAGRALMRAGRSADAYGRLLPCYRGGEEADPELLLDLARLCASVGEAPQGARYLSQLPLAAMAWNGVARAHRLFSRLPQPVAGAQAVRIAVLAEQTPQYLIQALDVGLRQLGFAPTVVDGGYRQIEAQILAPGSALYAEPLDAVVLLPSIFALDAAAHEPDPQAAAERVAARWSGLVQALRARTHARVVLAGYLPPPAAAFPNWQAGSREGGLSLVADINRRLVDAVGPSGIYLDLAATLRSAGQRSLWSPAEYGLARVEIPLDSVGAVAAKLAALLDLAITGRAVKCVVTDLDNTFWGGVVGDVGSGGIATGREGTGLAFFRYQRLLRDLKSLGVVLAIASKNDESVVEAAFAQRAGDLALGLDDFIVKKINWSPKGGNVRDIAEAINIGLDAVLFIDDNPMEREQVRQTCPGVRVPIIPAEPELLADQVAGLAYLDLLGVSTEDLRRHDMYASRARLQQETASASGSYDDFLAGLQMQLSIAPLRPDNVQRVHQLVMKTNQFNLTTIRRPLAALEAMAADGNHLFLCASLSDRLDDHGLIAVMLLALQGDTATIDTWLMSCRVFSRSVESAMLQHAVETLRARGVRRLVGEFRETAKNTSFGGLFGTQGFAFVGETSQGRCWAADLATWQPQPHHVRITVDG